MSYQKMSAYFYAISPVVRYTLAALVGIHVFFVLFARTSLGYELYQSLVLEPDLVFHKAQLWRLLSYGLIHDLRSPFHLLFNGLTFYFVGQQLEYRWGSRRLFLFLILTILGGSIFVCMSWLLGLSNAAVVGFSAAAIGAIIAWGLSFPHYSLHLFGVLPMTGMQVVWATVAIEFLFSLGLNGDSSAAHFGGMATAAILTQGWWRPSRIQKIFVTRNKKYFN